jgi:hypothetical protein
MHQSEISNQKSTIQLPVIGINHNCGKPALKAALPPMVVAPKRFHCWFS